MYICIVAVCSRNKLCNIIIIIVVVVVVVRSGRGRVPGVRCLGLIQQQHHVPLPGLQVVRQSHTVRKEMKYSGFSEILHEIARDTT